MLPKFELGIDDPVTLSANTPIWLVIHRWLNLRRQHEHENSSSIGTPNASVRGVAFRS